MYESRPIENRASKDRRSTVGRDRECIRREYQLEDIREYIVIFQSPVDPPLKMIPSSSSPSSRSHFSHSSSTPCSHSIDRNTITRHIPHQHQYPNHSMRCHPRHHAEASLVSSGSPETTERILGLQRGGDDRMMAQSPGLRELIWQRYTNHGHPGKLALYTLNTHNHD
jgi:hypothetical protein